MKPLLLSVLICSLLVGCGGDSSISLNTPQIGKPPVIKPTTPSTPDDGEDGNTKPDDGNGTTPPTTPPSTGEDGEDDEDETPPTDDDKDDEESGILKDVAPADGRVSTSDFSIAIFDDFQNNTDAIFNDFKLYKKDTYALLMDDYKDNVAGILGLLNMNVSNTANYGAAQSLRIRNLMAQTGASVNNLVEREIITPLGGNLTYAVYDVNFNEAQKLTDVREVLIGLIDPDVELKYHDKYVQNNTTATRFRLITTHQLRDNSGYMSAFVVPTSSYDAGASVKYYDLFSGANILFQP